MVGWSHNACQWISYLVWKESPLHVLNLLSLDKIAFSACGSRTHGRLAGLEEAFNSQGVTVQYVGEKVSTL